MTVPAFQPNKAAHLATVARVLAGAGVVRPHGPGTLVRLVRTVQTWGTGPAGGFASRAVRDPDGIGIVDELGELTWSEIHRRTNALARALAERGVGEGDSVAIMCRNHRGFIEATVAVAKLGADILYLNTSFAGPQLVDVLAREQPTMVIHDEEFTGLLAGADVRRTLVAWNDGGHAGEYLEDLLSAYDEGDLHAPPRHAKIVILTSGTTGTPKGAPRKEAGLSAAVSLLSRMPLKAGWRTHIAAPLFHTWGLAHMMLAMLLGSTMVLRRHFDAEQALELVQEHRCQSMVVIPVMLQRILLLDEEVLAAADLSSVEVVASSGSALPATLATSWMDRFGDNLYNIYGSTEVAYASIAQPADLRADPTSAGKPPYGTVVRILDESGREVPPGETGRIFVGNELLFDGYTGGGNKEIIDGLMASGDVGRLDSKGRLHVEGRDDDMIVSGGENVFPQEVENCLSTHPAVQEVAAVGVPDEDFGARLIAFVVASQDVTVDDLKDHVRANLARYKVPKEVVFVGELPRNATGKVLRSRLRDMEVS
jgi:fatty-acyl-CoA synthase